MSLEVRSKQADLEAVKAKCEHSDQYIESMIRYFNYFLIQITYDTEKHEDHKIHRMKKIRILYSRHKEIFKK